MAVPPPPANAPIVVVHDGGFDYTHPELAYCTWTNSKDPKDGIDNDNDGYVDDVHGVNVVTGSGDPKNGPHPDHHTHCGGIIAAANDGVGTTGIAAGNVWILPTVGAFTPTTECPAFEKSVDYVVALKKRGENIRIFSASFGDQYPEDIQKRFTAAVKKLLDADILFVVAAGNEGQNIDGQRFYPALVDLLNVITVAAMDRNNDRLAGFSNYGKATVEIAGLGTRILAPVPDGKYQYMSGTSMATPYVAGFAGNIVAKHPDLTCVQLRDVVLQAAEADPDLKGVLVTGGKVNPAQVP